MLIHLTTAWLCYILQACWHCPPQLELVVSHFWPFQTVQLLSTLLLGENEDYESSVLPCRSTASGFNQAPSLLWGICAACGECWSSDQGSWDCCPSACWLCHTAPLNKYFSSDLYSLWLLGQCWNITVQTAFGFQVPDKADYRTYAAQALVNLLNKLPSMEFADFIAWLYKYSLHTKVSTSP